MQKTIRKHKNHKSKKQIGGTTLNVISNFSRRITNAIGKTYKSVRSRITRKNRVSPEAPPKYSKRNSPPSYENATAHNTPPRYSSRKSSHNNSPEPSAPPMKASTHKNSNNNSPEPSAPPMKTSTLKSSRKSSVKPSAPPITMKRKRYLPPIPAQRAKGIMKISFRKGKSGKPVLRVAKYKVATAKKPISYRNSRTRGSKKSGRRLSSNRNMIIQETNV